MPAERSAVKKARRNPVDAAPWREEVVGRVLELRPAVIARMEASIPTELHAELESVTGRQLQALARVPPEGLTMRQLAKAIGVSGPAACTLADRLAAQGLIDRRADPDDRRVVRLMRSERGDTFAHRYLEAQRYAINALLARLSDEQVVAWVDIMEALAADAGDDTDGASDIATTRAPATAASPAARSASRSSGEGAKAPTPRSGADLGAGAVGA
ncbi:MAG: MarR family transcriptional regulator, partial [Solirubrobacteraceae bacterium]